MAPDGEVKAAATSQQRRAAIAAVVLVIVVGGFALLNAQQVKVNWLVSTTRTPLIVVIALSGLIGFGGGMLAGSRRRGKR
jgi:uncharacterized integral membrane protein